MSKLEKNLSFPLGDKKKHKKESSSQAGYNRTEIKR